MKRRRIVLLILAVAVTVVAIVLLRAPVWSAQILARRLQTTFQRPTTVASVRYRLVPFQAEVRDLRVGGLKPTDPPFLEVPLIVATSSARRLWDREVDLFELRIVRPRFHIHAFAAGGDDIPKISTGGGGGGKIHIRRVIIEGGEVLVDHERVPLDLDLPAVRVTLTEREAGVLAGTLTAGPGPARFGAAPVLELSTEAEVTLRGKVLSVDQARLQAPGTDLHYKGRVVLAPLQAEFSAQGPVDLGILDRHVLQTGFALQGAAHYRGTVRVVGSRLSLAGHVEGTQGVFDGVAVPRFAGEVSWDREGVRLRRLETEVLGGQATFGVHVPPRPAPARLEARFRGVDAEKASVYLFDVGEAGLGAGASGQVSLEWPRGRIRELSGRLSLDLEPRADGRTPLSGRIVWQAHDGTQLFEMADLVTPSARAQLRGTVDPSHRTDLEVEATSSDLEVSDELGVRIRKALGTPDAEAVGLTGGGSFRGRWRGTLEEPVFEGRFGGQDVGFLGVVWGRAEWAGSTDPREARYRSLVVRRGASEMWLDGRVQTGLYGEQDEMDLRVRFTDWPAADLVTALQWDVDVQGPVSGEAVVQGRRSAPRGQAHLTSPEGRYYGVAYRDLEVRSAFEGGLARVEMGRARVGEGTLSFQGAVSDDGIYDGSAQVDGLEASTLAPALPAHARLGGKLSGEVTLQGTLTHPHLQAKVTSPGLLLGQEGLGPLDARLRATGDGSVSVDGHSRSSLVSLEGSGRIGLQAPYPADLSVAVTGTRLDPFLRAVFPAVPAAVGIVASGDLRVSGPLAAPRELTADADVRALDVQFPDYLVRNRAPLRIAVREGGLEIQDLQMMGEGTDLAVAGRLGLRPQDALKLTVKGSADLRVLSVLTQELRGQGSARVEVAVTGTRGAPAVDGALDVEGVGVRMRGFPHGIEGLRGRVQFDGQSAHFAEMTGTVGGSPIDLEGQISYPGGKLKSFDVQASGRELILRYPEGLRSIVDVDLRLFGDASQQWLTGDVQVRQAVWTRRYDVASELLAASAPQRPEDPGGTLRYDVKVQAPGTLTVDNNLATLQARADLTLGGTYRAPVLLGRAEVDRGRVYFQGNTYSIRRGTIDFLNPQRLDPLFDIEAETRVRSYGVTLKVSGTLDRVYPTLTSDPPLSTVEILNLLAGGRELSLAQVQSQQQSLAATGAATLATGRISEELGLERGAAKLGLTRFSIDPSVVQGQGQIANTSLTVGRRITPDLSVVYSQGVLGTADRLVAVEYTLSDRVSILLTQGTTDGYGFDLRVRQVP